jgi:hypothetical protein
VGISVWREVKLKFTSGFFARESHKMPVQKMLIQSQTPWSASLWQSANLFAVKVKTN